MRIKVNNPSERATLVSVLTENGFSVSVQTEKEEIIQKMEAENHYVCFGPKE